MNSQTAPPHLGPPARAATSELQAPSADGCGRKKIALLEDDLAFREALKDFLEESGYEVLIGQSGTSGMHEVIGADCDIILCDMMIPSVSGDMFFRSIERLRPELCERFVFMTAYRGNAKINDFLAATRGPVLLKPFAMNELLEVIAFMQVRRTVRGLT